MPVGKSDGRKHFIFDILMRMRWIKVAIICCCLSILPTWSGHALCIYKGQMYAKTTLSQEFYDARWVVRARVTAADNHWSTEAPDEDDPWTLYHLQVITLFKGKPQPRIELFTYHNSGGFYLDLGGEYLLFLDPVSDQDKVPAAARNATEVNYACGQSKAWNEVSSAGQEHLADLSRGK